MSCLLEYILGYLYIFKDCEMVYVHLIELFIGFVLKFNVFAISIAKIYTIIR